MARRTPHPNTPLTTSPDGPVGAPRASQVKEVLITLRERLEAHLGNGMSSNHDLLPNLRVNVRTQLQQINQALARIEEGKYGVCADCLSPIEAERLVARPYSTLCAECQNRRDRGLS